MEKYLYLQLKRNLKILPQVIAVVLALLLCVCLILVGMTNANKGAEKHTRLKIAVSGDTDNELIRLGMSAMQSFDDSRYALELVELPEETARQQLSFGKVAAMVIFPENFIARAMQGDVEPVTFVTTPGAQNAVTLLKDEITKVIADIIIASEKGTYAVAEAVEQNDLSSPDWAYWDAMAMEYVDMILSRAETVQLEELGISQGLSVAQYYVCSMIVFLMMLFGICFVTVYVKGDQSLSRLLLSRGYSVSGQLLCEYLAHFVTFCTLVVSLVLAGGLILHLTGVDRSGVFPTKDIFISLCLRTFLVVVMLTAFNMMIFELSTDLISGVLLHFFSCIGLCYISGCFYPIYALPKPLQKLSYFLPTGAAREFLEGAFNEEARIFLLISVLAYSAVFLTVAMVARHMKTLHKRG